MMTFLKSIKKEEFTQCFKAWSRRMKKCVKANGEYFEGIIRDHGRIACVDQSGDVMVCV